MQVRFLPFWDLSKLATQIFFETPAYSPFLWLFLLPYSLLSRFYQITWIPTPPLNVRYRWWLLQNVNLHLPSTGVSGCIRESPHSRFSFWSTLRGGAGYEKWNEWVDCTVTNFHPHGRNWVGFSKWWNGIRTDITFSFRKYSVMSRRGMVVFLPHIAFLPSRTSSVRKLESCSWITAYLVNGRNDLLGPYRPWGDSWAASCQSEGREEGIKWMKRRFSDVYF